MLQQCCSPNPSGRAGRLQCDGLPHSRDTGNGSWMHSLCNSGADPSLNGVVFFSLSIPFLSSLSPPPHALFISSGYLFLHSTSISASVPLSFISHTLFIFFSSLSDPPPPSLHPSIVLFLSSNSCRPSTFPSMLPRGWPWSLTPPACLTQEWLWGAALGCWPFPGPLGPS